MKNKIKLSIHRFFAIAIIGLVSISGAYSFSGNGNANKKAKKNERVEKVDIVKIADSPKEDSASVNNEEILMKELMKKISRDYKTTNITIAIDGFDSKTLLDNRKEFTGIGEVKIGEIEWNKINFDVVLDEDKKPTKIVYEIKE